MHVRKDQVIPGSRRGGSCARPKLLRTTILGICADMHKASPYSIPSILGDMNTKKIPFVVGTYFMYVRKDQVALGSRRGGSCARPKIMCTTILGICADFW